MLQGQTACNQGEILLCGTNFVPRNLYEANRQGVYCIVEGGSMLDNQSLAENMLVNNGVRNLLGLVNEKLCIRQTQALMAALGLNFDPETKMKKYSRNVKTILEMVKYAHMGAKLIVLFNVMQNVSEDERALFSHVLKQIIATGTSVLLLGNQCSELLNLADRILVLSSQGRLAHTMYPEDYNPDVLKAYLTNSVSVALPAVKHGSIGREILRVEKAVEKEPLGFSLSLHEGEVLGLLIPKSSRSEFKSRRDALSELLSKRIYIDGYHVPIENERDAFLQGVGYIPDDPRSLYYPDLSIEENVAMPFLERVSGRGGMLRSARLRILYRDIHAWMDVMHAKFGYSPSDDCIYSVILRFLMYPYRVILLSQMWGVNDMRKADMLFWMANQLTQRGCAFIVISDNRATLETLCSGVLDLSKETRIV